MSTSGFRIAVYVLLGFLVVLDLILATVSIFFPEWWFETIHGAPYIDPQGLLKRTGALWAAFTVLQLIALFRWEKSPWWLVLIAGVRFTELFSEWTYLYVAESTTFAGKIGLFIAPPGNLVFGWILIWAYLRMVRGKQGEA